MNPTDDRSFDVRLEGSVGTLVAGFAEHGLAGLTAAEYLTTQLEPERVGHVPSRGSRRSPPSRAERRVDIPGCFRNRASM